MALSIDEANTMSSKYYDPTLTQQVYEESPFFYRLKQKNRVTWSGGTQIQWGIRYAEAGLARMVGPREQATYEEVETRTGAVLDWRYARGHAMISWDERVKNDGKAQVINLLADKATEMREDMYELFADKLYSTSEGANDFVPLDTIVDTTTTYAGIATTDAAAWAAGFENSAETVLHQYGTASALATAINSCTFGKNKPDLILTTRNLWSKLASWFEGQKQYGDSMMAKGGFTTVSFEGITAVADAKCNTSRLYLLDTNQFEWRTHSDFDMVIKPWVSYEPDYPEAMIKRIVWAGNLMCRMRKTSGKFTGIDYAAS